MNSTSFIPLLASKLRTYRGPFSGSLASVPFQASSIVSSFPDRHLHGVEMWLISDVCYSTVLQITPGSSCTRLGSNKPSVVACRSKTRFLWTRYVFVISLSPAGACKNSCKYSHVVFCSASKLPKPLSCPWSTASHLQVSCDTHLTVSQRHVAWHS